MAPNCPLMMSHPEILPDHIKDVQTQPHHHVQAYDFEDCPWGFAHLGHCVLIDRKTDCVMSGNEPGHICCIEYTGSSFRLLYGGTLPDSSKRAVADSSVKGPMR
jgi:hypothetical protein